MPLIEWDDSYSVNNAKIDDQHKKLIAILNKLHATMLNQPSSQEKRKILVNSVKEMYDYTNYHFRFEENYMDKINYPALTEHRRLHKNFDTKIYDYYNELLQGGFVLGSELISVLKNWLIDHILVEDKKFCLFLAKGQK